VAKSKLPKHITTRLVSVVLEMYELLQKLGDKEGQHDLTAAMKAGTLSECAEAIENWHENRLQKIFHQFSSPEDACIAAFALRVMRNSYPPDKLKALSEKAAADLNDLRTRVDRIHVTWKTDGYVQAVKELDALAARKTSSGPLLVAIATEYMEMGKNSQARDLLESSNYPEAIALYVQTLQALNKGRKAQIVLNKAVQNPANQNHPALVNLAIAQKYEAGKIGEVVQEVDAAIDSAGAWSSEMATLKAMAMSAMGERGDADRYMNSFIKPAGRTAGLAESWEVQKSIIRINLRRGGNFMFKAVAYTIELYKSKIQDPEITYSYGVESQRQGNSRGAVRYFNDAIEMDPAYLPAYKDLRDMGELTDEHRELLKKYRPSANL
jgi:tetratricopeptide (TPR) repeat protein